MNADLQRVGRWLARARPPRSRLVRALLAGTVASITNVGLLVGAVGLLVESANRPGLRSVAGALIVIELLAFLRSPLRFSERLSAHRLGFEAVTRWRRWLVVTVGRWDYSRWRLHAAGDLLERSLRDTDELQDLWLRFALPVLTTSFTMLLGDLVVAALPAHGNWLAFAAVLLAVQVGATCVLFSTMTPGVRADRDLRRARGAYQAVLVELSATAPDLVLLGRTPYAEARLGTSQSKLEAAEEGLIHWKRLSSFVPTVGTVVALVALWAMCPATSPLWKVVASMITLSSVESLSVVRAAVDTAVSVSAAGERLEELEQRSRTGGDPWPVDRTVRGEHVRLVEHGVTLVDDASFAFAPGRRVALVGTSGVGKSTFLRAVCGLDEVQSGSIEIGGVPVRAIDEPTLRDRLAYVASEPGLTRGYVDDVVRLGRAGPRDVRGDLATLGLGVGDGVRFEELSRGERQRVAVARALVTDPAIIVLDEPSSGLGIEETRAVLALLETADATVLVATHDPDVVSWCDDVFELSHGQLRPINR